MGPSPSGRLSNQIGASQLGCIVRLALAVAVVWLGFKIADPYVKYWQLKDAMNQSARFASTLSDEDIRRRIVAEVRKLDLPPAAERIRIQRRPGRDIVISLEYTVTLEIPRFHKELTFSPVVEAPL